MTSTGSEELLCFEFTTGVRLQLSRTPDFVENPNNDAAGQLQQAAAKLLHSPQNDECEAGTQT